MATTQPERRVYDGQEHVIPERIIQARKKLGLTQRQMAARIGLDYNVIGRAERGERTYGGAWVRRLARETACPVDWLTGRDLPAVAVAATPEDLNGTGYHEEKPRELREATVKMVADVLSSAQRWLYSSEIAAQLQATDSSVEEALKVLQQQQGLVTEPVGLPGYFAVKGRFSHPANSPVEQLPDQGPERVSGVPAPGNTGVEAPPAPRPAEIVQVEASPSTTDALFAEVSAISDGLLVLAERLLKVKDGLANLEEGRLHEEHEREARQRKIDAAMAALQALKEA